MKRREFLRAGAAAALAAPIRRRPRHRPVRPRDQMAHDLELSESLDTIFGAGHALPLRRRGHRQQVPHRGLAAGELVPSQQALDAVTSGSVECAHTHLLLRQQGPDARLRHRPPLRTQQSAQPPGGHSAAEPRSSTPRCASSTRRHSGRQLRHADGRLVPRDQFRRRPEGSAVPHRRHGRPVLAGSAWCREHIPHADVYAALEHGTIDAAEFVGPYDDEKLGLPRSPEQLLPRLVGRRRHAAYGDQPRAWHALPKSYQAMWRWPATLPTRGCSPSTMR